MIRGHAHLMLLAGVLLLCSLVFQQHVEGKPWDAENDETLRRKRIIGAIGAGFKFDRITDIDNNDIDDDDRKRRQEEDDDESNLPVRRQAGNGDRRYKPTYPPFPGVDEDYERWTEQPARGAGDRRYTTTYPPFPGVDEDYDRWTEEPARITPTTTRKSGGSNNNENGVGGNNEGEHKPSVVPWIRHHWGRARNLFKDGYNSVSNFFG